MAGENIFNMAMTAAQPAGIYSNLMQGVQDRNTLDAQRMQNLITQNQVNQLPLMNQYDATKLQQVQQQMEAQRIQDEQTQMQMRQARLVQGAREALALPESRRTPFIVGVANEIDPSGEFARDFLDMQANNPEEVQATLERLSALADDEGTPAQIRAFNTLAEEAGLDEAGRAEAASIQLGMTAGKGKLTGDQLSAIDPALGAKVVEQKAAQSGASEYASTLADLAAKKKMGPEVAALIEEANQQVRSKYEPARASDIAFAQQEAKDKAEAAAIQAKQQKALKVYSGAANRLMKQLGDTETGPIVGLIPAVTGNAKAAERVINQMGPVLKSLFRQSGEGAWTNFDQESLMGMMADRTLEPEARVKVMGALDALVETAGQPVSLYSKELGEGVTMQDVYQESIDSGLPIYEVMDMLGIEAGK